MAQLDTLAQADLRALRTATLTLTDSDHDDFLATGYRSITQIRGAYRKSLTARDTIAAHLVRWKGWSIADIAHVLCGRRHHVGWATKIVTWVDPPESLPDAELLLHPAQQTVAELRDLHSVATNAIGDRLEQEQAAPVPADTDPVRRLFATEQRLQQVRTFHDTAEAARDVVGATLVAHHGWRPRQVAAIAGADITDITAAYAAAKLSPPSDGDSGALRELARLTEVLEAETGRAETARREAAEALSQTVTLPRAEARARTGADGY
jgi:hypothetical protein